ncbi:MAG: hypothetical protein OXS28_05295 [Gammaproteobacteria bacterium]|nr:hypothetical protein [Gammaproteobacteria bacterium]MDE0284208.1 hypothetical protein [Gammaproteobacteria bacterium]
MSPELMGIISVGASLAALFIGLFAWLRQDMNKLDKRITDQGKELRDMITEQGQKHSKEIAEQGKEIEGVKKEIEGVKIEVAALKATVETYFRVRVDPPQTAAVAEPPEDYGAD